VIDVPTVTDLSSAFLFLSMPIPPIAGADVNPILQKDLENHYVVGNKKVATLIGDPIREILSYSEEHHIGFIVMGTHGRKGLKRVLMGSVTAGIVARSKIPVITVSTRHYNPTKPRIVDPVNATRTHPKIIRIKPGINKSLALRPPSP
jgi:hypothetical protein